MDSTPIEHDVEGHMPYKRGFADERPHDRDADTEGHASRFGLVEDDEDDTQGHAVRAH